MLINYSLIFEELLKGIDYDNTQNIFNIVSKNKEQYLREFMTIKISGPRQTGRTSFLLSLVNKGEALFFTDSFLVYIINTESECKEEFCDRVLTIDDFFTKGKLEQYKEKGIKYICIDNKENLFNTVSPGSIPWIYRRIFDTFGVNIVIIET